MIAFRGVTRTFPAPDGGTVTALDRLDLEIADGETHCLIGTSGCGKTTALRMVNRLERPDSGRVEVDGEDVATRDPLRLRRRIGYVIQTGGLFPHRTVADNIGLLCTLEGWPAERTRERVAELLDLVALPDHGARFPDELSGGQRQRVGVARALALDPATVLMDEPFGALDPITRGDLHGEFRDLLARVHKTVLLVTHDLDEAFSLGDRVTLMRAGRVVQTGTPEDLVLRPVDAFAKRFVTRFRAAGGR